MVHFHIFEWTYECMDVDLAKQVECSVIGPVQQDDIFRFRCSQVYAHLLSSMHLLYTSSVHKRFSELDPEAVAADRNAKLHKDKILELQELKVSLIDMYIWFNLKFNKLALLLFDKLIVFV